MKKIKGIIVASSLAILLSTGGTAALASTEVPTENTGSQSVTNISSDATIFKGIFEAKKSYEIINNDKVNKLQVNFKGKSSNLWMYNMTIYKSDGTIYDYDMESSSLYFDIPAGGKVVLTVTDNVEHVTTTIPLTKVTTLPTIKESDSSAIAIQELDNANYYTINNRSDEKQGFTITIRDNYGKMKGVVLYDKNGVITDEYTNTLQRSFSIPAGGKAVIIPGKEKTSIYTPTPRTTSLQLQATPIGETELRKSSFDIELQESPYMFNKVIKITNSGGDNYFAIELSSNLKKVTKYSSYREYLKAGESMEIIVAPSSSNFAKFDEYVKVKSGSTLFTLPIKFKVPEINSKEPEVSDVVLTTDGNKESTFISSRVEGTTVEFTFALESFTKNEIAGIQFGKPLATTNFTNDSRTYGVTFNREASMLAYEGFPLSASDVATKSYKISSNILVKSKDDVFFEDYFARKGSDLIGEITGKNEAKLAILFPFYTDIKTFFDDATKFDELQYLSQTGQIDADMTSVYVDELYLKKLMPSIEKNLESRKYDLAANTLIALSIKYFPQTKGIGLLWAEANAVKDWAIANVWDVWNENNAYWIGHNAGTLLAGYYDRFRYLDTYGVIHEMTADGNVIIGQ